MVRKEQQNTQGLFQSTVITILFSKRHFLSAIKGWRKPVSAQKLSVPRSPSSGSLLSSAGHNLLCAKFVASATLLLNIMLKKPLKRLKSLLKGKYITPVDSPDKCQTFQKARNWGKAVSIIPQKCKVLEGLSLLLLREDVLPTTESKISLCTQT